MKMDNYVIITSLKSETTYKLINRIPGLRLSSSSLPGLASRTYGKLDIKRSSPGIYSLYITLIKARLCKIQGLFKHL